MKGLAPLILLPLVSSSPLDRRQVPSADKLAELVKSGKLGGPDGKGLGALMGKAPATKAAKVEFIQPKIRPDAKRIRLTYGPYKLRAGTSKTKVGNGMSMDPAGTGYSYMAGEDFPRDVTLLATTSAIYDEGKKNKIDTAKGLYNHHNVFFDVGHKDTPAVGCEGGKQTGRPLPMSVIMAGATEEGDIQFASGDTSIKTGYYLPKDARVSISLDVVNYNNEERTVWMIGEMEYLPGKAADLLPSSQHVINLGMCSGVDGVDIRPPVGQKRFKVEGKDILITRDGYFVNTRGHLHDGGLNMVVSINGKEVCNSKVIYGGEGHMTKGADGKERGMINTTTECDKPIKVSKGDRLSVVANYDLEQHPAREVLGGGMGGMSMGAMGGAGHNEGHGEAEQMALLVVTFAGL